MIGLDCLNACGCSEVGLARGAGCEERRRAVIRGYAYIFKDVRANQKFASLANGSNAGPIPAAAASVLNAVSRSICGCATAVEPSADRRKATCLPSWIAVSTAYDATARLVNGTLRARLHSHCSLRVYAVNALQHRTGWVQRVSRADVCTKRREVVEVSLEILEVQREVQDVGVAKTGHCARAPCCFA